MFWKWCSAGLWEEDRGLFSLMSMLGSGEVGPRLVGGWGGGVLFEVVWLIWWCGEESAR